MCKARGEAFLFEKGGVSTTVRRADPHAKEPEATGHLMPDPIHVHGRDASKRAGHASSRRELRALPTSTWRYAP